MNNILTIFFLFLFSIDSNFLPPVQPWSGKSEELIIPSNSDDPWITPSEKNSFLTTPNYEETITWLKNLVANSSILKLESLGKSPDHRDIWMVIASLDSNWKESKRPLVLAQSGIHSGEIDGKDAGLMLLRDLSIKKTKTHLLEKVNFAFIPILSVDAHENSSPYSRVNQNGPQNMGWRTNSRNLNLNRDYMKVETKEIQLLISTLHSLKPDLYIDLHVTDGADYQYDITYTFERNSYSPQISNWLEEVFSPLLSKDLIKNGHLPVPYYLDNWISAVDWSKGFKHFVSPPRFSTGYGNLCHIPTLLVENHSLKPYKQRVLGNYVLLESALEIIGKHNKSLKKAIEKDKSQNITSIPLTWTLNESKKSELEFFGIESVLQLSSLSGGLYPQYTGKKVTKKIPLYKNNEIDLKIRPPKAYWIPAHRDDIIAKLKIHQIYMETIDSAKELKLVFYRIEQASFDSMPFEGRFAIKNTQTSNQLRQQTFPKGSVRVPVEGPLSQLIVCLLEPTSPDSFFSWGFFYEIFQMTEYIEPYIIEPMAKAMIENDPILKEEFTQKLINDEVFKTSPKERLKWFYSKTPYIDPKWKIYPIGREE